MGHRIFGDSPIPRYVQLADVLRGRIGKGVWREGARLPTLDELMDEFDVARVTARQAIEILAKEGLVCAHRGRGTFVTGEPPANRKLQVETTLDALIEMYRGDRPELLNIGEEAGVPSITREDGRAASRYFAMRRVHSRDGVPYSLISIYIEERVFRKAPMRFRRELAIPLIASLPSVEIARARQSLTLGAADIDAARHLGIPVNSPVAHIRRVFNGPDDTVLYLSEATLRGDFVRLDMDLKPRGRK